MKTLNYGLGLVCLSLAACGGAVKGALEEGMNKIPDVPGNVQPASFNAMAGAWTGDAATRRGGETSTCTVALTVNESATEYKIEKLSLSCPDGSNIDMDPMTFGLQAPAVAEQQAHDVTFEGKTVGWSNFSHDAFYATIKKDGTDVTIHITQTKDGLTLERLSVAMNGEEMIGTDAAALHPATAAVAFVECEASAE